MLLQISLWGIEVIISAVEQLKMVEAGERAPWIPLDKYLLFEPLAPST